MRSCYSVPMRFYNDSDTETQVEWYWSNDEAKGMPFAHCFGDLQYDSKEFIENTLGERYTPRKWRNGGEPYPTPVCGLTGTESQWGNGSSIDEPLPEVWPGTNVPKSCCPPPPRGIGGLLWGGSVAFLLPPSGGIAYGGDSNVLGPALGGMAWGGSCRFAIPVYDTETPVCSPDV
jgi:hypothetical protein